VVGLDGATFRLILPWVNEGKLPALKKIMDEGAWGGLQSTIHPLSPQAWASFMTGNNPGRHGIFEFIDHKPGSYDIRYVNGGSVRGEKLWGLLSKAGRRVCVINVPFTYPPEAVNGCLIAGLDAPGVHSQFCHPSSLLEELTERFGEYRLRQHPYKAKPETYLDDILEQFEYILNVSRFLKDKEPWDLFVVVFEATDLVQHFYWHYAFPEEFGLPATENEKLAEGIFQVYKRIDDALAGFVKGCGPDENIVVMSDHGFAPCRKIFFMDNWLSQQGYLAYRGKDEKAYTFTQLLHLAFQKYVPNRLKERITGLVPHLKDRLRSYLTTATIEWKRTRAFSLGIDSTNIFVNLKGRFPEGTVEEGAEYDGLVKEISEKLVDLVDPATGEKVVERVYLREELYHGEALDRAPDLLVTWKGFEYNTRRSYGKEEDGRLFGSSLDVSDVSAYSSLQKSGTHHEKGIFIVRGPDVRGQDPFEGARIIDLAPTILYLLGETVPQDMDGRVLEEIVLPEFLAANPVRLGATGGKDNKVKTVEYDESEEAYVKEKLQGLGYID
jgi:predicted AlkP superfamily phosphohydrolase/phosphomutase